MQFHIFHPTHFEKWDYSTPDERGIGGSETSQIELAWRLARRGHQVNSYAPVPWSNGYKSWRGSTWAPLEDADFSQPGVWLIYRSPETLDKFELDHPDQQLFIVSQDESYAGRWTDERVEKLDWMLALCQSHRLSLESDNPGMRGKVRVFSNGLKPELLREIGAEDIERNPHRMMWASSPDRGLFRLLKIFRRVREWVHDAELHCFYGFENIDKLIALGLTSFQATKDEIMKDVNQPGVVWHGRVTQPDLIREWRKTAIFPYCTNFRETSCITIMEAQAAGAIPVVSPVWALYENLVSGIFVQGDCEDSLTQARFTGEIYRLMSRPELQEQMRVQMTDHALARFNWERMVDQLEAWLYDFADCPGRLLGAQFAFQNKHVRGRILNIGCDEDAGKLKARGAVNLDVNRTHPALKRENPIDVEHDAREPLPFSPESFDTCVIGDVIEHMTHADAVRALSNARQVLAPGGQVIVTYPEDHRTPQEQNICNAPFLEEYVDGVAGYHRHISKGEVLDILQEAGLAPLRLETIDYSFTTGYGIVAEAVPTAYPNPDIVQEAVTA